MKKYLFLLFLTLLSAISYSQTREDVISSFKQRNWTDVINYSTKLIKENPKDFELLYWRAIGYYYNKNTSNCLTDIDSSISANQSYAPPYLFKAQLLYAMNDKENACINVKKAIELGAEEGRKLENDYCGNSPKVVESLAIDWPDSEGWTLANKQSQESFTLMEFIRKGETLDNWKEIGTMMVMQKPSSNFTVDNAFSVFTQQVKKQNSNAEITFIEKCDTIKYPWLIYKVETPNPGFFGKTESQLYYMVLGTSNIFLNFRAIKEKRIPEDLKNKWISFFKTATIQLP